MMLKIKESSKVTRKLVLHTLLWADDTGLVLHIPRYSSLEGFWHSNQKESQWYRWTDKYLFSVQVEKFGFFVLKVPPPLAIGTVYLEDGDSCPGFIAEGHIANDPDCIEITEYGGWLNYKNSV